MNAQEAAPSTNKGNSGTEVRQLESKGQIKVKGLEKDEDEESLLSSIEHQESDSNRIDISDYCVSSDAETEKMSDDKVQQSLQSAPPHISELMSNYNPLEVNSKKHSNDYDWDQHEENRKRTKLEEAEEAEKEGSSATAVKPETASVAVEKNYLPSNGLLGGIEGGSNDEDAIKEPGVDSSEAVKTGHEERDPAIQTEPRVVRATSLIEVKKIVEEEENVPNGAVGIVASGHGQQLEDEPAEEEIEEEVEDDQIEEEEDEEEEEEEEPNNEDVTVDGMDKDVAVPSASKETKSASTMLSPIEIEQQRLNALEEMTEIEYKFVELRQKLYDNKLQKLQTELQMCREGSHPDLQAYYQKIASIRDYKLRRAYQRQKYELKCIDKETRATRTFIHQDFIRQVSDIRNQLLNETTQKWYDINKERRDMDVFVPEVSYHVPIKIAGKTLSCITGYAGPAQQRYPGEPLTEDLECENIQFRYRSNAVDKLEVIVDRMRLNNELSDLEGLKRYFNGFPGAPELSGLRDSEVYEDMQELPLQRH